MTWPIFQEPGIFSGLYQLHKQFRQVLLPIDSDPIWSGVNSLLKATQSVQRFLKTTRFTWTSSAPEKNPGTRPVITDLWKKKKEERFWPKERVSKRDSPHSPCRFPFLQALGECCTCFMCSYVVLITPYIFDGRRHVTCCLFILQVICNIGPGFRAKRGSKEQNLRWRR